MRAFQQSIVTLAQQKLGRPLTATEHAFIIARGGFLALEAIRDTVHAATAAERTSNRDDASHGRARPCESPRP